MKLFPKEQVVGIFRGFSEGGLEFHADLVLPYRSEFQSIPMHGQFVVVQLESEEEAVLGRITSISAQGRLASAAGEDFGIRSVAEDRPIPEDLREQYLKYQVDIRVLGVVRMVAGQLEFAPSHRRLPHVGSKVAFLSDDVFKQLALHNGQGAELGFFALGEFIYSGHDSRLGLEPWMVIRNPAVVPRFDVQNLVSRRSFVFARAGFGKSNLVKLLFSDLYKTTPTVKKRQGREVPVGTLIFDPDGEYFWPDDKDRPGLCDVPELERQVVVFTPKHGPSPFYNSFVAGPIKLDIRRLRPSDVVAITLPPDRQAQQNVLKLKRLSDANWRSLVNEVYANRSAADEAVIAQLLGLQQGMADAEIAAAKSNMLTIVDMLHDPSSQMMDMLFAALRAGKICVVDVSQIRGTRALVLSGLVLRRLFDHNQNEWTKADPQTIPVVAVIEEAQSVLNSSGSSGEDPYITWVKEGRKYDLGALMITQQPGSIAHEILSQGDNWFIFHLLSAGDLQALKKANAHFSDDLLSALLNEPIAGNGIFWSSASRYSYPISLRVLLFESMYSPLDAQYSRPAAPTFATELRTTFEDRLAESLREAPEQVASAAEHASVAEAEVAVQRESQQVDAYEAHVGAAIRKLKSDTQTINRIRTAGMPWRGVGEALAALLPEEWLPEERSDVAYKNVATAMDEIFGQGKWTSERRPSKSKPGAMTTWIVARSSNQP